MNLPSINLDESSPVPLYRQLAEALRYRISSGLIQAGVRLPTLREAASLWGVNLHTVRRAYLDLQEAGLVEVTRPLGTFVAPGGRAGTRSPAEDFVHKMLAEAETRFGMRPEDLARAIGTAGEDRGPETHAVECSHTLSQSLARQIQRRWGGNVHAVHLADLADVGPGQVVGTYFHFNEIRAALSHRIQDVHFVSIAPDRAELAGILAEVRALGATNLILCERDPLMAPAVLADVTALLGTRSVSLRVEVPEDPATLLRGRTPVLFSPGSWDRLTDEHRRQPHAFLLSYRVSEADLAARSGEAAVPGVRRGGR